MPCASGPTTTRSSTVRPAASPTVTWPASCPSPSSSIVAEHRHSAAGQAGKQVERGEHRPGRRVVAVVDDRRPAQPDELGPMWGGPATGQRRDDRVEPHARRVADGRPGQGVVHGQAPWHRDGDGSFPGRRPEAEPHPVDSGAGDLVGAHVGAVGESVAQGAGGRPVVHPRDDRVVLVEDRRAVRRQRLEQLALGLLDRLERPDPRQVDRLHGGDDPDRRPGHRRQLGDLATDVHAHLEDGRLVLRAEPEQRQRQPDLVVHVALGPQRPARRPEDRRGRLLRRGLGDAPRDADHERVEPPAPTGGHRPEGGLAVGHPDDGHVPERRGVVRGARHEHGCRAPGDRLGEMGVAVRALARAGRRTAGRGPRAGSPRPRRGSVAMSARAAGRRSGGGGRQR